MKKRGKKSEMQDKRLNIAFLLLRYTILLVFGIFLSFFYKLLFYVTIYPVFFILSIFYDVSIKASSIFVNNVEIQIVNACVAGSAYYLLLILNLTTPMNIKKRAKTIVFSLLALLILNILRIIIFSALYVQNFTFFDITHKLVWYVMSVIFVVAIWFGTIKLYKIKEIPICSDLSNLYKKRL